MARGDLSDEEWAVIGELLPGEWDRNRIERLINRLKQASRIATRYDKTAMSFLTFLCLTASRFRRKDYVNRSRMDRKPSHDRQMSASRQF